jgi:topoisomerase-4 subunit B
MIVTNKHGGKITESKYKDGGKITQSCKEIGTTNRTGVTVRFKADSTIFKSIVFNPNTIKERIRETAYLYKNVKIIFDNEIDNEQVTFVSETGISEYVDFINDGKSTLNKVAYFEGEDKITHIEVEVALQYTTSSSEIIISFANSVKTPEGGSHETAFKSALTESINEYARK